MLLYFQTNWLWYTLLAVAVVDVVVILVHCLCNDLLPPSLAAYPLSTVCMSALPSFVVLLCMQPMLKAFYGLDRSDPDNFALMGVRRSHVLHMFCRVVLTVDTHFE